MSTRIITVLDPTATPHPVQRDIAERTGDLRGRTLVLVSNSKPNVSAFYDALEPLIRARLGDLAVARETKPTASVPLGRDRLDEIGRMGAVAVVAICD
jgi:hypothetical protein